MAEKYDGWVLKRFPRRGNPYFILRLCRSTRREVIEAYEEPWSPSRWKKRRRIGDAKIVKVKLVEVDPQRD